MWKIVSHKEKGLSHQKNNLPCQDRTYNLSKNEVCVISLADGAGSCKHSELGASAVTKKVCEILCDEFDYLYNLDEISVAKKIMSNCILDIKDRFDNISSNIKDFSSTLLFVAVKKDKYIIGHIGDGVIGCRYNNKLDVISYPQNGEYINSTYFITNTNDVDKFNIFKGDMKDIDSFILMSDGISESLYNKNTQNLSNATNTIIDWLDNNSTKKIEKALKSNFENLFMKKTTDDCSLIVMKKVSFSSIVECDDINLYLNNKNKKQIKKSENILKSLRDKPKSKKYLSKNVHIKEKYINLILKDLESSEFISVDKNMYYIKK